MQNFCSLRCSKGNEKISHRLGENPAKHISGKWPVYSNVHTKTYTWMLIAALFVIVKN